MEKVSPCYDFLYTPIHFIYKKINLKPPCTIETRYLRYNVVNNMKVTKSTHKDFLCFRMTGYVTTNATTNKNGFFRRGRLALWIGCIFVLGIAWLALDKDEVEENSADTSAAVISKAVGNVTHTNHTDRTSLPENADEHDSRINPNPLPVKEVITSPEPVRADGFIEDPEMMCAELLKRANGTQEGNEPWRSSGGLLWKFNSCGNQGISVLGNHLSRWYMVRAVAAAAGVTIQLDCESPVTNLIPQLVEPSETSLDGDTPFSWQEACQQQGMRYPHGSFQNGNGLDRVVSLIRSDMRILTQNVLASAPWLGQDLDEATIHLRTGDIARQDNVLYGMVPFQLYTKLLPRTVKTIGIVTAPFQQARPAWGHGDADLNEAVVTAAQSYIQKEFPDAIVSIRNDDTRETMAMTYVRMVSANWSFCCPSTFCLFPALANMGESYILQSPLFGGSPSWIDKVTESFRNIHYINEPYVLSRTFWQWNVSDIVQRLESNITNGEYRP
jgi:hypothetical protein